MRPVIWPPYVDSPGNPEIPHRTGPIARVVTKCVGQLAEKAHEVPTRMPIWISSKWRGSNYGGRFSFEPARSLDYFQTQPRGGTSLQKQENTVGGSDVGCRSLASARVRKGNEEPEDNNKPSVVQASLYPRGLALAYFLAICGLGCSDVIGRW